MSLASDFLAAFNSMNNMQDGGDVYFATRCSEVIKTFVTTLKFSAPSVTGADAGPSGTFTGAAEGTLAIAGTGIKEKLIECFHDMSDPHVDGDEKLAHGFANGLLYDAPVWTVSIIGTTVVGGEPVASTDTGNVTPTFDGTTFINTLISCFRAMTGMQSGGNAKFATDLANAITAFYTTTASYVVTGATHLSGSTGSGTVTIVGA